MTAPVHIFELAHNWRNWRKSLGAVKPRALALRQCASAPVPLGTGVLERRSDTTVSSWSFNIAPVHEFELAPARRAGRPPGMTRRE